MDLSPYFEAEDALIRNRQEMFLKENYFDDLEQDGENVGLRNDLVYCLVQLGRYDRAMSQLQILDDQKYNFAEIANSRALISVMTTQLGDAESYLLEGLERYPDNERCVANLTYVRYLLANRGGNLIDDSDDPNKAGVVELDARNIPWAK
jgi:tetratricopeptide (TPR) repeat protein